MPDLEILDLIKQANEREYRRHAGLADRVELGRISTLGKAAEEFASTWPQMPTVKPNELRGYNFQCFYLCYFAATTEGHYNTTTSETEYSGPRTRIHIMDGYAWADRGDSDHASVNTGIYHPTHSFVALRVKSYSLQRLLGFIGKLSTIENELKVTDATCKPQAMKENSSTHKYLYIADANLAL